MTNISDSRSSSNLKSKELMLNAWKAKKIIPSFAVPYLPMMSPIAQALIDLNSFGFIHVAQFEWELFEAKSQAAIQKEYSKLYRQPWMRLHQDHVPAADDKGKIYDYMNVLRNALDLGFDSIMIDGSMLPLEQNIEVTSQIVALAEKYDAAVEGEVGAIWGGEGISPAHSPMPSYEELYRTKLGFTSIKDAAHFVTQTGVDWLSIVCGNIHGNIQNCGSGLKKTQARLNIEHLAELNCALKIPLVLHGGSGIPADYIQKAVKNGISKINIAFDIREPYAQAIKNGKTLDEAQDIVYRRTCDIIKNVLQIENSRNIINPA